MEGGEDDLEDPYAVRTEDEEGNKAKLLIKPRDNRPRKTERRADVREWTPIGTYSSVVLKDQKLQELASMECNGGMWGNGKEGKGWKTRVDKESKRKQVVRVRNCCFAAESKCPARVRELQYLDGDEEWASHHGQSAPLAALQLAPCASSAHAWWSRAARHSRGSSWPPPSRRVHCV